jgi:hypothetical protein
VEEHQFRVPLERALQTNPGRRKLAPLPAGIDDQLQIGMKSLNPGRGLANYCNDFALRCLKYGDQMAQE